MALFKVLRGNEIGLEDLEKHDGYAYFVPETGNFYIDAPLKISGEEEPSSEDVQRIQLNANLANKTKVLYDGIPEDMSHILMAQDGIIKSDPVDTSDVEEIAGQHVTLDELNSLLNVYAQKSSLNDYVLKDEAKIFLTESDLTPYVLSSTLENYVHKDKENNITGSINLLNNGIQCDANTPISTELSYYRPIRVSNIAPEDTEGNNGDIWVIYKEAEGKIYLSKNNIVLNDENYNKGIDVVITNNSDGQITLNPASISGISLSLNTDTNVLTIKGDGKTQVNGINLTVGAKNCQKYTTPSDKIITINTNYNPWSWGDQTEVGDVNWWQNLYTWIQTSTLAERQSCIGKTKKLALSSAVLGANQVLMLCIGADEDGENTLTFQTMNVLPKSFESSYTWMSSTARTQCIKFYDSCQIQNFIKKVQKGTSPSGNSNRNGTAIYNWETVWLLSEREIGGNYYSPISISNSTLTNAECTYGFNASYSYYTTHSRIKCTTNAAGEAVDNGTYYFLRSRSYETNYYYFDLVASDGGFSDGNYNNPTYTARLAPAFVIGKND